MNYMNSIALLAPYCPILHQNERGEKVSIEYRTGSSTLSPLHHYSKGERHRCINIRKPKYFVLIRDLHAQPIPILSTFLSSALTQLYVFENTLEAASLAITSLKCVQSTPALSALTARTSSTASSLNRNSRRTLALLGAPE